MHNQKNRLQSLPIWSSKFLVHNQQARREEIRNTKTGMARAASSSAFGTVWRLAAYQGYACDTSLVFRNTSSIPCSSWAMTADNRQTQAKARRIVPQNTDERLPWNWVRAATAAQLLPMHMPLKSQLISPPSFTTSSGCPTLEGSFKVTTMLPSYQFIRRFFWGRRPSQTVPCAKSSSPSIPCICGPFRLYPPLIRLFRFSTDLQNAALALLALPSSRTHTGLLSSLQTHSPTTTTIKTPQDAVLVCRIYSGPDNQCPIESSSRLRRHLPISEVLRRPSAFYLHSTGC
ncbi:hypothetical protein B0T17DRAFT_342483 [Bombardia bombarda]|uniref:Uncharacterized protein n=1 Tax=Bombardia bombarda TaxID=252184 RepID=A0AA40BYU0_9PEZI|nr:hypothetical protein B0T17DRAFT_342483 [Bombardia bombarda]